MIEFLFLDLDDTILDFHKAEEIALGKALQSFGIAPTPAIAARYSAINKSCWQMLERGEMSREQVLVRRFRLLFEELGSGVDPALMRTRYEDFLSIGHYFLPGAEQALEHLSKRCRLFLASNGTARVQAGRLTSAGLYRFFEQVFISEEIGFNKPSIEYFEACFARIPGFVRERAMMVGDSLTSDIRGGNNAGLLTCWINPAHEPRSPEIPASFEVETLAQLEDILSTLGTISQG